MRSRDAIGRDCIDLAALGMIRFRRTVLSRAVIHSRTAMAWPPGRLLTASRLDA